ncbi:protein IMPACT-like [Watersipora subatra]|uniref:protein IMPACT-like n=1 Tax=Watersipora subatra TaxID=2589382 RepID=UPI00355C0B15
MEDESNIAAQIDEIEVMAAIYGDDWIVECEGSRKYVINIDKDIRLRVRLTDDYPSRAPPVYELDAVPLSGDQRLRLSNALNQDYLENMGQQILHVWVMSCKGFISDWMETRQTTEVVDSANEPKPQSQELPKSTTEDSSPDIFHDEPITDRKSTFQAHVAKVTSVSQVSQVMEKLLRNKKISGAAHNIQAYRILLSNGCIAQDCDDDGETSAGERVLHLLKIVDVTNVLVVVSRWWGGIKLGPDRFKHINNCARNALEKQHFISTSSKTSKKPHKKN